MDYINLGRTGLKVSRICLGCMTYGRPPAPGEPPAGRHAWALNEEQSQPFLKQALDLGINFWDTANVYSSGASEEVVGRFLKKNARRESVVVATKVWGVMREEPNGRGLSRKEILFELEQSLRRLEMDYVDLYQIHRWDEDTPIEETMEALHDAVKAGKVRYIGASSMYSWQFAKALYLADKHLWTRFVSMQNHYNLLYREEEREMIPLCRAEGVGVIPGARWRVVGWHGRGRARQRAARRRIVSATRCTRRRRKPDQKVVEALTELSKKRGVPQAQLALGWMLAKPGITAPIVGATKAHHLEDAVAALSVKLTAEEIAGAGGSVCAASGVGVFLESVQLSAFGDSARRRRCAR